MHETRPRTPPDPPVARLGARLAAEPAALPFAAAVVEQLTGPAGPPGEAAVADDVVEIVLALAGSAPDDALAARLLAAPALAAAFFQNLDLLYAHAWPRADAAAALVMRVVELAGYAEAEGRAP